MSETGWQAVVSVRQRLEGWRKDHGGRGCRIPEGLWNEAVGVARVSGLRATARELRLDYERLRAQVSLAEGKERGEGRREPAFVDLGMGALCGGRTVVELAGRDGERMRIDVTGASAADVVGLTRAFWSRQS